MIDHKKVRERIGYTRGKQIANAKAWLSLAKSFHAAAGLLSEFPDRVPSDTRPFALNAAFSIELILKSIIAKKMLPMPDKGHDLLRLCGTANLNLSDNQKITLELLTETIVWAGRYPGPKSDVKWDNYQDNIVEKHIIRSRAGNVFKVMANRDTFPDWGNYKKIWDVCIAEFQTIPEAL